MSRKQISDSASGDINETSLRRWAYLQQNKISMVTDSDYGESQTGPITDVSQLKRGMYFPAAILPNAEQNKDVKYENEIDKYTPAVLIASSDISSATPSAQRIK